MKKNLNWMFAAALFGGFALTACTPGDNAAGAFEADPSPIVSEENVFDFEDGVNPFTADSRMSTAIQENADKGSNVLAFVNAKNAQNGYAFAHYNFGELVEAASAVNVTFDYYNHGGGRGQITIGDGLVRGNGSSIGNGKLTYGASGAIFRIGSDKNNFFVNGKTLGAHGDWSNKWLTVDVTVDNINRTVEWAVKEGDEILAQSGTTEGEGEEAVFVAGPEEFFKADANEATQIDAHGQINNSTSFIDNLKITKITDNRIKYADYTVRYVRIINGKPEDLKTPATRNARVGSVATLLDSDKGAIYELDDNGNKTVKWVYDSDDAETTPIAEEGTVITLKFVDSGTYQARLTLKYGDDGKRISRTDYTQFLGDALTVYYPIAVKKEATGKWYLVPRNSGVGFKSRQSAFTGTNAEWLPEPVNLWREQLDVEYVLAEDIAFGAEFEEEDGGLTLVGDVSTRIGWTDAAFWEPGNGNINEHFDRYSNGRAARLTEGSYFATPALAEGTYKMYIYGRNGSSSVAQTVALYVLDAEGNLTPVDLSKTTIEADAEGKFNMPTLGTAAMGFFQIGGIAIPEGGKLVIKNDGQATYLDLDFIVLSLNPEADLDALTN